LVGMLNSLRVNASASSRSNARALSLAFAMTDLALLSELMMQLGVVDRGVIIKAKRGNT